MQRINTMIGYKGVSQLLSGPSVFRTIRRQVPNPRCLQHSPVLSLFSGGYAGSRSGRSFVGSEVSAGKKKGRRRSWSDWLFYLDA